jgi:hypothetical protein
MERIPGDGGGGSASLAMPGLRGESGEDRATAVQGAVQQAIRGDRGGSLRECRRQSGGAAFPLAGDHGACDRPALLGTMGPAASQAGAETDGSGRLLWEGNGLLGQSTFPARQPDHYRTPRALSFIAAARASPAAPAHPATVSTKPGPSPGNRAAPRPPSCRESLRSVARCSVSPPRTRCRSSC